MADIPLLRARNVKRWENATFKTGPLRLARQVATRLVAPKAKDVYLKLQELTGVPWFAVAMIHERESGQKWDRSLAQGDPWNKKSTHVPKGRVPFKSFVEAGVDALVKCAPYASKWKDWSPGGMLTLQEMYNGLGYANKGRPSAYVWSGTNQYVSGKYVSDGVYDPNAVDSQLGCAVMLKAMMELDDSIYAKATVDDVLNESAAENDKFDPAEYPDPTEPPALSSKTPDAETPPVPASTAVTTRTAAGTAAAVVTGGQLAQSIVGPANDMADQFTSTVDKSGAVITAAKQVVAVPKSGFWFGVLSAVTSPTFIICALLAIAAAWAFLVWRQRKAAQL